MREPWYVLNAAFQAHLTNSTPQPAGDPSVKPWYASVFNFAQRDGEFRQRAVEVSVVCG